MLSFNELLESKWWITSLDQFLSPSEQLCKREVLCKRSFRSTRFVWNQYVYTRLMHRVLLRMRHRDVTFPRIICKSMPEYDLMYKPVFILNKITHLRLIVHQESEKVRIPDYIECLEVRSDVDEFPQWWDRYDLLTHTWDRYDLRTHTNVAVHACTYPSWTNHVYSNNIHITPTRIKIIRDNFRGINKQQIEDLTILKTCPKRMLNFTEFIQLTELTLHKVRSINVSYLPGTLISLWIEMCNIEGHKKTIPLVHGSCEHLTRLHFLTFLSDSDFPNALCSKHVKKLSLDSTCLPSDWYPFHALSSLYVKVMESTTKLRNWPANLQKLTICGDEWQLYNVPKLKRLKLIGSGEIKHTIQHVGKLCCMAIQDIDMISEVDVLIWPHKTFPQTTSIIRSIVFNNHDMPGQSSIMESLNIDQFSQSDLLAVCCLQSVMNAPNSVKMLICDRYTGVWPANLEVLGLNVWPKELPKSVHTVIYRRSLLEVNHFQCKKVYMKSIDNTVVPRWVFDEVDESVKKLSGLSTFYDQI